MKKQTLPKMHFACSADELRPSFNHVEVTKEDVTASNGSMLVTHKTKDLFSDEFIEAMPDKFYLHRNVWKELSKPHLHINFENNMIVQYFDGYRLYYAPLIERSWKYPNWRYVIPSEDTVVVEKIRLDFSLFDNFIKAYFMPGDNKKAKLNFYGIDRCVLITNHYNDSRGIIMPCTL
jgi:hypothetical protein